MAPVYRRARLCPARAIYYILAMEVGEFYSCPYCGEGVLAAAAQGNPFVRCRRCSQEFVFGALSQESAQLELNSLQPGHPKDDELDGSRIRQIASLRRAAYRSRSYCVIATGGCIVGAAELLYDAAPLFHAGRGIVQPVLYLLGGVALLGLGGYFARWVMVFHRESKAVPANELLAPPDFSNLNDGRQIAKNLENLHH